MNKQAKQVIRLCRRIVKQVRHDDYFSATVRANFVVELEKFDSKKGFYLIVVRDRRVPPKAEALHDQTRLRVNWIRALDPFCRNEVWEMANTVLNEMQDYERNLPNT